jgi:hypothetical protein
MGLDHGERGDAAGRTAQFAVGTGPEIDEPDDEVQRLRVMQRNFSAATRQTPLDRADDLGM